MHKTFKANPELLHAPLCTNENGGEVELHETTIEHSYLSNYHHWDGYVEGLGETLQTKYNDYDKALNLMLFGGASTINGDKTVTFYNSWRGEEKEKWEWNKPMQDGWLKDLVGNFRKSDQEYLYVYAPDWEGNYRWFYMENDYGECDAELFDDLESRFSGEEYLYPIPLNEILNGSDDKARPAREAEETETVHTLICQVGKVVSVEAVSKDLEKLKALMKEKVLEQLEDRFGSEDELDPDCDEYELDLYKSAKEMDGTYWSDEDDECPVEFYITEADWLG